MPCIFPTHTCLEYKVKYIVSLFVKEINLVFAKFT